MTQPVQVAIIGAGPYGLSLAAHLRGRNISHRIFGPPMDSWRTRMPRGMTLKSPAFASTLYSPGDGFSLKQHCQEAGMPYADQGFRVSLETFTSYGLEFQTRIVPELDERQVVSLDQNSSGFELTLEDGEVVAARKVVVAVGITHFGYTPPELCRLPHEFVTHSSEHNLLDRFVGREVIVVGAGASAVDLAALLNEKGASVQLVARKPAIHFPDPSPAPATRSLWNKIRRPVTGIGSGWRSMFCAHAPLLFHSMPLMFRSVVVQRFLGPAPGLALKERVVGKVPLHLGFQINHAEVRNCRITLVMTGADGAECELSADHVIAGTGYRVDVGRLSFLKPELRAIIRVENGSPVLSSNFESSVRGLYFAGLASALSFGPLLRFAMGAKFASRRLSMHLAKTASVKGQTGMSRRTISREVKAENVGTDARN